MNEPKPIDLLLVEDNPQDLELTLRALHRAKVANHIEIARDGEEALNLIFGGSAEAPDRALPRAELPRVVLLDLKLPKVDGLEVLRRLKSDARTKNMPVVMLTSSKEQRDLVESYRLGVNSYIVKPVDSDGFLRAVGDLGLYWLLLNQPPAPNPR